MARFKPIDRKKASEQVAEQIRSSILGGLLRPGQRLPSERDLAAQFEVTRTTLREALKKLTQPLVRWHAKLTGERPRVAYCPMERGSWFQPDGVIGNPYGGIRMPRCGSFVTE